MDALGSNNSAWIQPRPRSPMRFPAAQHDGVKRGVEFSTRPVLSRDGLRKQRLDTPYIRETTAVAPARVARGAGRVLANGDKEQKKIGGPSVIWPLSRRLLRSKQIIESRAVLLNAATDARSCPAGQPLRAMSARRRIEDIDYSQTIMLIAQIRL